MDCHFQLNSKDYVLIGPNTAQAGVTHPQCLCDHITVLQTLGGGVVRGEVGAGREATCQCLKIGGQGVGRALVPTLTPPLPTSNALVSIRYATSRRELYQITLFSPPYHSPSEQGGNHSSFPWLLLRLYSFVPPHT